MIFLIIISLYAIAISYYIVGFKKLKTTSEISSNENLLQPLTHFSIIIPFRNEAERLPGLLNSLSKLNYPKDCFEVLLINDASTDTSLEIIENFRNNNLNISILVYENQRTSAAPKKDAITLAIAKAKYEWLLTTDADCLVPSSWLNSYNDIVCKSNYEFIAGPVFYKTVTSFIEQYQLLDVLSLQGITMGSFGHQNGLFCNGANLGYTKTLFKEVNGFSSNNNIASGDDVFMLADALKKFPHKVGYLKSRLAIVETFPETSWKNLINQRTRWAKKTGKQKNVVLKLLGLLVFLANISVLTLPLFIVLFPKLLGFGIAVLVLKLLMDSWMLKQTAVFFGKHISVLKIGIHFFVYAGIATWVTLRSPFTSYQWKGRKHRH